MDISYALVIALTLNFILSMACILLILHRAEQFLSKSLVFMKSNNIHDVLDASSLLRDRKPEEEEAEVVDDDIVAEQQMNEIQKRHRNHLDILASMKK